MAKTNRRKRRAEAHKQAIAASPVDSAPPSIASTEADKRQDRKINWALAGAAASFFLNVLLAFFAYQSAHYASRSADEAASANKLAQTTQDRATGKLKARFEFVDDRVNGPDWDKLFRRQAKGSDQMVFRIESVDELARWSPYVRIRNTGTEAIDAIKVDVQFGVGAAYGTDVKQIIPMPLVYNNANSFEFASFGKLEPGKTAKIYIAPLLLSQMSLASTQEFPDNDKSGCYIVNVLCRLVNSPSYDGFDDGIPLKFNFHWRPSGFTRDAKHFKELLDNKPWINLD